MERLQQVQGALVPEQVKVLEGQRLKITDNRTGKTIEVTLKESKDCYFVNSKDIGKLVDKDEEPLRLYDPGYMDTICNTSRISYIDGDKGVLEYRGIPIEQLAERSTFLEVAFLLIYGELPSAGQLNNFSDK